MATMVGSALAQPPLRYFRRTSGAFGRTVFREVRPPFKRKDGQKRLTTFPSCKICPMSLNSVMSISILVWLTYVDDKQIDDRELAELQMLLVQIKCDAEVRRTIRESVRDPSGLDAEALGPSSLSSLGNNSC